MALLAWYPFNGNATNNGCGEADLTVTTTPSYTNSGKLGKALSTGGFKWSAEQTEKILNNKAITIAFWIYPHTNANSGILFGNDDQTLKGGRQYSVFLYPTVNDLHLSWQNSASGSTIIGNVTSGVFPSNKWTHCCITYEKQNVNIYINGVLNKQYKTSAYNAESFHYETQVISNASNRYINDFRIYNNCLSAKEIKEISKCLIVHYPLNQFEKNANILTNSDFSSSAQSGKAYRDESKFFKGLPTFKIDVNGATSNTYTGYAANVKNVKPGDTITASAWVYTDNVNSIDGSCEWRVYQTHTDDSANNWSGFYDRSKLINGKWSFVSKTYILDKNMATAVFNFNVVKNGTYWIGCPKVEYGTSATPWCPSIDSSINWFDGIEYDTSGYSNNALNVGTTKTLTGSPRNNLFTKIISSNPSDGNANGASYIKGEMKNTIITDCITLSWWSNMESWAYQDSGLLSLSNNSSQPNDYQDSAMNQFDSVFKFYNDNGSYCDIPAEGLVENNKWHHYALVYNGNNVISYRDAKQINSKNLTSKLKPFKYIYIGLSTAGGAWRKTSGNWSDFRMYNSALNKQEIEELYNIPVSITKNGTVVTQSEFIEE